MSLCYKVQSLKGHYPLMRLASAYKSRANVSFPAFVDHLIRTPPNQMDKHWAPYTKAIISFLHCSHSIKLYSLIFMFIGLHSL